MIKFNKNNMKKTEIEKMHLNSKLCTYIIIKILHSTSVYENINQPV